MGCLPYVKFWTRDWLASARVRRMTLEEKGAYIDLLAYAWEEGGIPAAPSDRARLLGITSRQEAKLWPSMEDAWASKNGHLVNPRMERERKDAQAVIRLRAKAGRASGRARRKAANG